MYWKNLNMELYKHDNCTLIEKNIQIKIKQSI